MQNKQLFSSINPERTLERLKMKHLVDELNEASNAYYNGQDEIMTNKEFDDKLEELKKIEEEQGYVLLNSPTHKVGYEAVDSLPKFKHPYPALSLDKTKDTDKFVNEFRKGIANSNSSNQNVVVMFKEDGSTVQAYYMNGKLDKLVTRGNGEIGSVITHNAIFIAGIPLTIPVTGEVVVRGEALMSYQDFENINSRLPEAEQYKNPRNLAAASISMLDPNEVATRHIVVKAFNLVKFDSSVPNDGWVWDTESFSGRLNILSNLGFKVVEHIVCPVTDLKNGIDQMSAAVDKYPYPVDGLVAAMDNYVYAKSLPGTEHHPNIMQGYAFKWADECEETTLREIEWSPSRTGLLNPVAIFDPVELEGTTVSRASLHNLSIMRKMRIHIENKILVFKANKIIPQVDKNLDYDKESDYTEDFIHDLIGYCPTCGAKAEVRVSPDGIETVYCPNEDCPEKMIGKFVNFCSRDAMDIQGMSEETIKKLVDAGFIKEYSDFFCLQNKPEIASLPGFGDVSWNNMCQAAEKARSTDFVRFIVALSIPNIGKGQAKTLLKYINDHYDELSPKMPLDIYNPEGIFIYMGQMNFQFEKIEGFGDITAGELRKWIWAHLLVENSSEFRLYQILKFIDKRPVAKAESAVTGKSFCITGKLEHFNNRQALVDKIESLGGKWVDSVSSKTDYLINNDVTSTSGKNKKAKELNVPIISEEDFMQMMGG